MVIKLYGERNTGTNYLLKLIRLNLITDELRSEVPSTIRQLQKKLPGNEWLRNLYFRFNYKQNLGWKHSSVRTRDELIRFALFHREDLWFLTLTKNPYSWLLSLHQKPYHQRSGKHYPDFETFLKSPWKTVHRDGLPVRKLQTPVDLWNLKVRSYQNLPIYRTLHLSSEAMHADPESLIARISDTIGAQRKKENFVNLIESTKDKTLDSYYYRDYYLNERWKEKLTPAAIQFINQHLDKDLLAQHGYELL